MFNRKAEFELQTGLYLKRARKKTNETQEGISIYCGAVKEQVSRWERGLCSIKIYNFANFCRALRVDPGEALTEIMAAVDAAEKKEKNNDH